MSKSDRQGDDLFSAGEGSEHLHDVVTAQAADPEPLGALLARVRQEHGLDLETCARELRLPARVLERIEGDRGGGVDYEVYMRGYLRKYGAYLGVERERIEAELGTGQAQQPTLVATGGIPRSRYLLERYATAATYVVLTGVIIVPLIWLGVNGGLGKQITKLAPLDSAPVSTPMQPGTDTTAQVQKAPVRHASQRRPASEQPLMASIAPFPAMDREVEQPKPELARPESPAAGGHSLSLDLSEPSWVEVTTADGKRLEYALLPAGTHKQYDSAQALNVRIGNAKAAQVSVDGKPLALNDYRHANVAHFEVNADDGQVTPEHG
ncbi:RodZ domain-containing protein [Oleiagrimonas sp. C23AA]|uniref:RodZ domain-containing protein n=1 Tax=Oleiagrimonas sp. C23AA TaxID=2719047 RepID=UPI0031B6A36F